MNFMSFSFIFGPYRASAEAQKSYTALKSKTAFGPVINKLCGSTGENTTPR